MAFFRKAVLASTIAASGLASTAGIAVAQEGHYRADDGDKNVVNLQGAQALNQPTVCDNQADVLNVLPIHNPELAADLPILNRTGDGNKEGKTPNGDPRCNPDSKTGSTDSPGAANNDAHGQVESQGGRGDE